MRLGQLLQLLSSTADLAKLDPNSADAHPDAARHIGFHRKLVRVGIAGGVLGGVMGVAGSVLFYMYPPGGKLSDRDTSGLIYAPIMLILAGFVGGACWAGVFAPRDFIIGPIGQRWMKALGVKNPSIARGVALFVALLVTGIFIALPVLFILGKM
jgi:hypothetical protein